MNTITRVRSNQQKTKVESIWAFAGTMKEAIAKNKRGTVIDEVRVHLKRAQKFGYTNLVVEFAACLQDYYYMEAMDRRIGKKYEELVLFYNEVNYAEKIVAAKFAKLFYELKKKRSPGEKLKERLRKTCVELKAYLKYPSTDIWISTYTLCNILAYLENENSLVIDQCHTAIAFFQKNNISRTAHFYKDMTPALIRLGRYEEAREAIDKAINNISKGTVTWSTFLYYRVIIELHDGNYKKAHEIYQEATRKKQIDKAMSETWNVVKSYFNFLILSGRLEGASDFRVGKFLNNIELFVSDKAGINFNVIVIKLLFSLNTDKGRGRLIDNREAIEKYGERHLEKGSRSRLFLQLLNQVAPGNFNRVEVEARGRRYLELMPEVAGYDGDVEVVPFEVLWGMVLEGLD